MSQVISMEYVNYRGERAMRVVRPVSIWYGSTKWHTDRQWLLRAYDVDKGEQRDFALRDCNFRTHGPDWEGFGRALMAEGWPVCDIDGSTLFWAAKMFGLVRAIPGGFDPEKHEDPEGLDLEAGDEWYEWGFPPENSGGPEVRSSFVAGHGFLNTDAGPVDREAPTLKDEEAADAAWGLGLVAIAAWIEAALKERKEALTFADHMVTAWSNALERGVISEGNRTSAGIILDEAIAFRDKLKGMDQ